MSQAFVIYKLTLVCYMSPIERIHDVAFVFYSQVFLLSSKVVINISTSPPGRSIRNKRTISVKDYHYQLHVCSGISLSPAVRDL